MGSSPVVSASGHILLHRFYYFHSFQKCHPFFGLFGGFLLWIVGMTCLFIASKIEEELRPVSTVIKVFYRLYQRRIGQDVTKLTETDPVYVFLLSNVDLSSLAIHINWHRKAGSVHVWVSFIRHNRSPSALHPFLHQKAGLRFADGPAFVEHSIRYVSPSVSCDLVSSSPSVSSTHRTRSPVPLSIWPLCSHVSLRLF